MQEEDITSHQERQQRAVRTKDGSFTFYSSAFDQHYHSVQGAETESAYVFLKGTRLDSHFEKNEEVSIFESGFGTGLNFLLAAEVALKHAKKVVFTSVEKYPLSLKEMLEFNYMGRFDKSILVSFLTAYERFEEGWNSFRIHPLVELNVFVGDFKDLAFEASTGFDCFFHDAFSPDVNPDFWTVEVFEKLLSVSRPNSLMSTYCSATRARAAMAKAGWFPARFPGGIGKREMTVAFASQEAVDLPVLKLERLIERWDNGEFNRQ